jgi:hypothetical protein
MHGTVSRGYVLAICAMALMAAGSCGSDDGSDTTSTAPAKPAVERAPAKLLGSYTTKLKPSDLPPNPPGELTESTQWELTIANSGGVDNGPVFAIANSEAGSLEDPTFGVKGDLVLLHREECASGDKPFYDNRYRYKLSGKALTFTKVKNSCPDEVALTILTSEPWTKVK